MVYVAALGETIPIDVDTTTSSNVAAKEVKKTTKSLSQPQNAKGDSDLRVRYTH